MAKKHEIRNSTAEFLIFHAENKEQGIEVFYKDENVWATQKQWQLCSTATEVSLQNIWETFLLRESYRKMQYVQNLHILHQMAKAIRRNSIALSPSLPLATE